jgi:hypothetical protein
MLRDVERHLAGDQHIRVDESIERDVDRALRRVLDRNHAVLGAPALDLVEDVGDVLHRDEVGGRAEVAHRCLVREGCRRAQVCDGQRVLEGQRGGEDLAPDRAHRARRQWSLIGAGHSLDDLGLALRDIVRPVLLPFEVADLEGGVTALVEE